MFAVHMCIIREQEEKPGYGKGSKEKRK